LEKQWSLSGFQFKGAGWYVTDYAGKKPDTPSSTATDASAPAEKTSSTASTTKPESASNTTSDSGSKKEST
ncbi:MAG: FmdB family zinc ribbon protein, partial [Pyrinomonadaceae bacterium]